MRTNHTALSTLTRITFYCLLLILFVGKNQAQINLATGDVNTTLLTCASNIINRHYHNRSFLAYAFEEDFVTEILRGNVKFTVLNLNANLEVLKEFKYKHYFYVVVINNADAFETFIIAAYRTMAWNSRANILVVFLGNSDITEIFRISWKFLSINVSVLTTNLTLFTYFPISEGNCGKIINKKLIYVCGDDIHEYEIFPRKLFKYFHGCPIRVLPMKIEPYIIDLHREVNPGYEVYVIREIALRLNLSIEYVANPYKHWGTKLSDGSYTDMYHLLKQRLAHLMVGMILANESYVEDFEATYPHSESDLTFHVPTPLIVAGWKNFIIIFDSKLWYALGTSMVVTMCAWWAIGKSREHPEGFDSIGNCFFKVWCVIFSCFNNQPKSWLIRLIFFFWTTFSFLIICTYTSVLIGFLTRPSYEKEIATTTDMVNSKLQYGGLYVIRYIFNEKGNPSYLTLYERFVNCPLSMECTNRTAFKRDFGVIKNARQVSYFVPLMYTYPNGRPRLKRVRDKTVPQNTWMQTVKGFLYMERVNDIILRLRENGLISKWDHEATTTWKSSIEEPPSAMPLTLTHLKFAFICLGVGCLIATFVFLFEIFK